MTKVRIIPTARAVIFNEKNELLLVKNVEDGVWFTPGGWLDGFETLEETVVREVYEELGITIEPLKLLKIDYYKLTAEENTRWKENVNKIEHYFLCKIIKGNVQIGTNAKNLWADHDAGHTNFVKFFSKEELRHIKAVPAWIKTLEIQ